MKKSKIFIGLLFIAILVGLTACNKQTNNNSGTSKDGKDTVIKLSNDTKKISVFKDMIMNIDFTNDIAGTTSNSLTATITGTDKVKVTFNDAGVSKEIKIDGTVKGLGVVNNNENDGYVHIITDDNHVYYVELTKTTEPVVLKYEIENVDSFASLYTDLEGKGESQAAIVIKTKAGDYYTDYKFSTDSIRVLRKITE